MNITDFHFIRPYWLLALIPLAYLLWHLGNNFASGNHWRKVIDKHLLPYLLINVNKKSTYWPLALLALIYCFAIIALAGPTWSRLPQPVFRSENAKVILLDLSQRMLAQDIAPNRLTRAKYKILDILKHYSEGQTGLAVFSSEAYTVSPLTNDTNTIAAMVPVLSPSIMPVLGSQMGTGLIKAEKLLQQAGAKHGTILLITASVPTANTDAIAEKIHDAGYTISVLGVGSGQGAPIPKVDGGFVVNGSGSSIISKLNISALEKLADLGGGRFSTFTNTNKDINYLLQATVARQLLTKAQQTNATTSLWRDEGHWFILLLLPLVLLAFRRGWLEEITK